MGSTSDLPVMEKACKLLNDLKVPFEVNALSAHRTPDALLSIVQMPPGIPVATVGVNGAMNAAILAVQMLALTDENVAQALHDYKANLGQKITKANEELALVKYEFKTN